MKNRTKAHDHTRFIPQHAHVQLSPKRKRSLTLSRLRRSLGSTLLQSKAPLCLPFHCTQELSRPERPARVRVVTNRNQRGLGFSSLQVLAPACSRPALPPQLHPEL